MIPWQTQEIAEAFKKLRDECREKAQEVYGGPPVDGVAKDGAGEGSQDEAEGEQEQAGDVDVEEEDEFAYDENRMSELDVQILIKGP